MDNKVKNKNSKALVTIIVLLIIIIIILGLYILMDKGIIKINNTTNKTKQVTTEEKKDEIENKILYLDDSKEIVYENEKKIPVVNIDSKYAIAINNELSNIKIDENSTISYSYYTNKNVLSLVFKQAYDNDYKYYHIYNIDIYTGNEINNINLLKIKEIDESQFSDLASNIFKDIIKDDLTVIAKSDSSLKDKHQARYNLSISKENFEVTKVPMYLNKNNNLVINVDHYALAGGDAPYQTLVNFDLKQLEN